MKDKEIIKIAIFLLESAEFKEEYYKESVKRWLIEAKKLCSCNGDPRFNNEDYLECKFHNPIL